MWLLILLLIGHASPAWMEEPAPVLLLHVVRLEHARRRHGGNAHEAAEQDAGEGSRAKWPRLIPGRGGNRDEVA